MFLDVQRTNRINHIHRIEVIKMVNETGTYIGEPTVIIHRRHGTPEEVARNRENFRKALCKMYSEVNGYPTEVTLDWTEFDEHAKTLEFDN